MTRSKVFEHPLIRLEAASQAGLLGAAAPNNPAWLADRDKERLIEMFALSHGNFSHI